MAFIPTWSPFSAAGLSPSTTPPALFFPALSATGTVSDLAAWATTLITPNTPEVVFVIPGGIFSAGASWSLFTLTAGAHAPDSTHVLPNDYDATTNAKHWFLTLTGTVVGGPTGNVLVDQFGNVLTDDSGNSLSY